MVPHDGAGTCELAACAAGEEKPTRAVQPDSEEGDVSALKPNLECTDAERANLRAILGECHCDAAFADRGLSQSDCGFCEYALDLLELVRERDALRAQLAKGNVTTRTRPDFVLDPESLDYPEEETNS